MTFSDAVAFVLAMAAGIVALTALIFAGSLVIAYLRRAERVD